MTGSGNDFVFLDGRQTGCDAWPADRIAEICHRRNGAGADGLVILTPGSPKAPDEAVGEGGEGGEGAGVAAAGPVITMDFFNNDGSRAAMCGNAALCATRLSANLGLFDPAAGPMVLATDAGAFHTRIAGSGWMAEINLPPFEAPEDMGRQIPPGPGELMVAFTVVGVPHLVVLVDDLETVDLMGRGRELRNHTALAPAGGANVNFVAAPGGAEEQLWPVRTYERGVEGETLACGTGTVACAAALSDNGVTSLPRRFLSRGGAVLSVAGRREGGRWTDVWLCGEGRLVYRGILED